VPIFRKPLRADVHEELLGLILQGTLTPGQRLRDTDLAQRFGVSRTPVREALLRLEREGFVASRLHRGFSVKPLCESEIREVYPLVGLLECSALEAIREVSPEKLALLDEISRSMRRESSDPLRRIGLDQTWHRVLVAEAGNQHLFRILDDLKRILLRYEYSFMRVSRWVAESLTEHRAIAVSLERGQRRQAARLLRDHWDRTQRSILTTFFAKGSRS
jgi:DNA-binding GntR family transcriptional regulator